MKLTITFIALLIVLSSFTTINLNPEHYAFNVVELNTDIHSASKIVVFNIVDKETNKVQPREIWAVVKWENIQSLSLHDQLYIRTGKPLSDNRIVITYLLYDGVKQRSIPLESPSIDYLLRDATLKVCHLK